MVVIESPPPTRQDVTDLADGRVRTDRLEQGRDRVLAGVGGLVELLERAADTLGASGPLDLVQPLNLLLLGLQIRGQRRAP